MIYQFWSYWYPFKFFSNQIFTSSILALTNSIFWLCSCNLICYGWIAFVLPSYDLIIFYLCIVLRFSCHNLYCVFIFAFCSYICMKCFLGVVLIWFCYVLWPISECFLKLNTKSLAFIGSVEYVYYCNAETLYPPRQVECPCEPGICTLWYATTYSFPYSILHNSLYIGPSSSISYSYPIFRC